MEGLRGFLACWVMLGHIGLQCGISTQSAPPSLRWVALLNCTPGHAVSLFMILSGFVIFYLLTKSQETWGTFVFRRFFRLYPVFFLSLAAGILLNPIHQHICAHVPWSDDQGIILQSYMARDDHAFLFANIFWHVPMLHGIVPETVMPYAETAFLPPAWSISTEWQFYLLAPLLFWMARRYLGFVILSGIVAFCAIFPVLFPAFHKAVPLHASIFTQLPWFYVGMVSFFLYTNFANLKSTRVTPYKCISFLVVLSLLTRGNSIYPLLVWGLFFTGIKIPQKLSNRTFVAPLALRVFNSGIMQYLGRISYPIYLIHWPVLLLGVRAIIACAPNISEARAYLVGILLVGGLTLVLSHFVHEWVEKPGIEFAKRVCQRRNCKLSKELAPKTA